MGDRYLVTIKCPKCGYTEGDVYYAPTCGFLTWRCPKCKRMVDLAVYTGISEAEASNKEKLERIIAAASDKAELKRIASELAQDEGLCSCGYPFPKSGS